MVLPYGENLAELNSKDVILAWLDAAQIFQRIEIRELRLLVNGVPNLSTIQPIAMTNFSPDFHSDDRHVSRAEHSQKYFCVFCPKAQRCGAGLSKRVAAQFQEAMEFRMNSGN